jgi:hypothetical protein
MARQVEFLGLTESGRACQSGDAPQASWRLAEHAIVHGIDADHGPFTRQDVVREAYLVDGNDSPETGPLVPLAKNPAHRSRPRSVHLTDPFFCDVQQPDPA